MGPRPLPMTTPQIEAAQRDLYLTRNDGTRELLVPDSSGGRVHKVIIRPTSINTFKTHAPYFAAAALPAQGSKPKSPSATRSGDRASEKASGAMTPGGTKMARSPSGKTAATATVQPVRKVGVNKQFWMQLRAIFRILIPRSTSKEVFLFSLHTFFLLLRTYLSLLVAKLDGIIVRDLVSADAKGFLWGLVYWFALALPSTYTNSMIRFLQNKLSISFRTRLTRYVHDLYLSDQRNYYKIINLDSRVDAADQLITTDLARFCDNLASLYSNISKPTLDLILFNIQLGRSIGRAGSAGLFVSYIFTAWILRKVTPAFGKLAAVEAKLEGDFRAAHSRLITNAEEIAFYNGAHLEQDILTRAYLRLIKHVNSIFKIRIAYSMTEDFVIKYLWSAAGYCLISIPVFFGPGKKGASDDTKVLQGVQVAEKPKRDPNSVAGRTESYISNRRLLLSLADAGGRLMYSYKELAELAGHTSRVYSLISTLHQLNGDKYQSVPRPASLDPSEPFYDLGSINGKLVDGAEGVEFNKVPIVAPAPGLERGGELLVRDLKVTVAPGEHMLITGPNGVGKTGVARVLAGLWPTFEGVVRRPARGEIFYLPQRPYLSLGSLRDQVIYPHSLPEMRASGKTDADLREILKHVHLAYLPEREGGFDTRKEWKDVLSGGEKQRMNIARLFYHLPRFGILDECTSAVSTDVEGLMYQHAKDLGITLITISHRPSLFKYHSHLLRLTGEKGTWELSQIGTAEEKLSFAKEVEQIEAKLQDVESWKARLKEIENELAFQKS
ncbi:uncharacterized protein L969DRAFT_14342 [Mixia osmundae IAM 14324]|uniref:ABC transporter domain-containing protein n=1 Tax=Mixia osmundae (strain CBS 9802 / IAM 14324 / JCM 22182 / KY 12970) TaxID=764103 RepID=G7DZY4_MIXOS|nr:uncharacterized protein L969DRAFT_14342 [Mixia osmundae IAM 14324]KEI42135.1 hypothetical protein L969DRAFT_14342 [Mixia osmundae IAM 14324]GAA96144.1 hypothetical protein E5Q_02805 [Mixia osmundae IAM 14324]